MSFFIVSLYKGSVWKNDGFEGKKVNAKAIRPEEDSDPVTFKLHSEGQPYDIFEGEPYITHIRGVTLTWRDEQ